MAFFNKKVEERASAEHEDTPLTTDAFLKMFGADALTSAGVNVTVEKALGVPAIFAAVNFIADTIASLPLSEYEKNKDGRKKTTSKLNDVLHDAVNEECTSFDWRKQMMLSVLLKSRSVTFIDRNKANQVKNLWQLDVDNIEVKRRGGKKIYIYKENGVTYTFQANQVIDVTFMLDSDGISSLSPILTNKNTIGLMLAVIEYGSKFFNNGGVPPFALIGKFPSPKTLNAASNDLHEAVKKAKSEDRLALSLPEGYDIKPIGIDVEKAQLVELQKFLIEEAARIFSLPPVYLQDYSNAKWANVEQQDLNLVKHTIGAWVQQIEQELNLKLYGRSNKKRYCEHNLDGLMRGDFKTRMEGYAQSIQNGILTPNEVRKSENREDKDGGDNLLINSASVPLKDQENLIENPESDSVDEKTEEEQEQAPTEE